MGIWMRCAAGTGALLAGALLGGPAWAVNKCVGADGQITYQEMACPSSAKESKRIATRANGVTDVSSGLWTFRRTQDDMTKKVSCLVISPVSYPAKPIPQGFYPVNAVIVVGVSGEPTFGLRTSEDRIQFHNDLAGMGVKTSVGDFMPISTKSGSHLVIPSDGAALVSQLEKTRDLQARVRFWPYEQLYDLKPIPMDGYHSAMTQARGCAQALK